jgi:hypothetical protein
MFNTIGNGIVSVKSETKGFGDLRAEELDKAYQVWRNLRGAKHILNHFYRLTYAYVGEWKRTGVPVSAMLVWELVRHKVKHRINRAERMEIKLAAWGGYSLCNNFRARVAKEVMERRPEWNGIFDTRENGKEAAE